MPEDQQVIKLLERIDSTSRETRDRVIALETRQKSHLNDFKDVRIDVKDHGHRLIKVETRGNIVIAGVSMVVSGIVSSFFFLLRGFGNS